MTTSEQAPPRKRGTDVPEGARRTYSRQWIPFLEIHVRHAATGRTFGRGIGDDSLGGEEQRSDGTCVLKGRTGHLGGIDDTGGDQVLVVPLFRR